VRLTFTFGSDILAVQSRHGCRGACGWCPLGCLCGPGLVCGHASALRGCSGAAGAAVWCYLVRRPLGVSGGLVAVGGVQGELVQGDAALPRKSLKALREHRVRQAKDRLSAGQRSRLHPLPWTPDS
jgi:hypothetical protein